MLGLNKDAEGKSLNPIIRGAYLGASFNLPDEEVNTNVGNAHDQSFRFLRILEDPSLRLLQGFTSASLDHVREEGPGRTAEANQGTSALEPLPRQGDGVKDISELLIYIHHLPEFLDIRRGVEGVRERRTGVHQNLHAHCLRNDEDVAEDDRGIEQPCVPPDRLPGNLCCERGCPAYFEEFVRFAYFSEF